MSNSKFLSDSGWKDIAAKNNVKDNGLLKKLADFKRVGEDKHDEALKLLDEALKLAGQLKKDKKTAPAAGKYLDELTAAAEVAVRDIAKAKAEADKAAKAKAEAEKKAQAEAAERADDDDDDETESPELLTTKLKPLLRLVAKGETMHTLVAKSGKQVVVMLSRKPIPPARRKMLADQLGGGSTKYYPGHCALQAGATTFVLKAEVAGMSKLIKLALLEQTGLRVNKVKCRGEDGDDDDGDADGSDAQAVEPGGSADVGDAFKTRLVSLLPRIKEAVAAGGDLAQQAKAKTTEAGTMAGRNNFAGANDLLDQVEELLAASAAAAAEAAPSLVQLAKARVEWNGARAHAVSELARLKKILQHEYRDATSEQAALTKALQRLDSTIDAMDDELNDRLDQVVNAQATQRKDLTAAAEVALQRLIKLVSNDEILQNIDGNELAPEMVIAAPLRAKLTDIAQYLR